VKDLASVGPNTGVKLYHASRGRGRFRKDHVILRFGKKTFDVTTKYTEIAGGKGFRKMRAEHKLTA